MGVSGQDGNYGGQETSQLTCGRKTGLVAGDVQAAVDRNALLAVLNGKAVQGCRCSVVGKGGRQGRQGWLPVRAAASI